MNKIAKYYPNTLLGKTILIISLIKVIGILIPIEFSNSTFRENCNSFISLAITVSCFVWVLIQLLTRSSGLNIFIGFILSIPIFCVFAFVSFLLFIGPCIWQDGKDMYTRKKGNAKIVLRMLNCGATTDYSYQHYYVKPLTPLFNIVWKVDTSSINREEWEEVIN